MLIASPLWAASNTSSKLTFSTTALNFNGSSGNVSTQPITVAIVGSKPVTVTSISFSNSTFFATLPALPVTVSAGQSLTGQISARPQSSAQTGKLTIVSNVGTYTVSLSETAATPASPSSHKVNLSWHAPASSSDTVDSYQVDRAVAGSTAYSSVGTTTAGSTTFTDSSVSSGKSYTYEVRSVDENGNMSNPSNAVTLSIP